MRYLITVVIVLLMGVSSCAQWTPRRHWIKIDKMTGESYSMKSRGGAVVHEELCSAPDQVAWAKKFGIADQEPMMSEIFLSRQGWFGRGGIFVSPGYSSDVVPVIYRSKLPEAKKVELLKEYQADYRNAFSVKDNDLRRAYFDKWEKKCRDMDNNRIK